MDTLISGSSGFVGQNLVPFLQAREFGVYSLMRDEYASPDKMKADVFIHLAGKAHDLKKTSEPGEYYAVNTELTKNLFNTFLQSGAKVFITLSSVKAVADSVDGELTEKHLARPETHYGKSKLQAEEYILSKPIPEGKRVYILRPCMIHGPGNKGNLNLLFSVVKRGIPYPLAAFHNRRSFLSIDNLCYVILRLIQDDFISSGVYNVADDETLSTNEVIRLISEVLERKPKLWALPQGLLRFIAGFGDKTHLPLNNERLQKLTEDYVVSNKKIVTALGRPLPVSAKEGLKKTIRSFINHG